ncbi:MAG: A/G-specific adenine glycosylase [Clostridia bacterium]|nr:A/G-specific adenine glycosylase [Clostridia bacterium]
MENFARSVIDWYDKGHRDFPRRKTRDPYRIWVSEIMLQQTRAETVISYYNRFMELFPDIYHLADAEEQTLLKAWEGLGYYSRARNLQKCARLVCEKYEGHMPDTYDELLKLPGIGPYTAGAVASIAFGQRCAAVDGNVLRVMARVCQVDRDIRHMDTQQQIRLLTEAVLPDTDCDRFSNAMMELGACVCTPKKPRCSVCPVVHLCGAYREKLQDQLPVRSKDKEKKQEYREILLLYLDDTVLVMRQGEGLLEGLYTFPNLSGWSEDGLSRQQWLKENGIVAQYAGCAGEAQHVFTHIVWNMRIYEYQVSQAEHGEYLWANREQLGALPMATAIKKARQICLARLS